MKTKKRQPLALLLSFIMLVAMIPTVVFAQGNNENDTTNDIKNNVENLSSTTIYVSNSGNGDGTTAEQSMTFENAIEKINEDNSSNAEYIISLVENIDSNNKVEFKNHKITILGNGNSITNPNIRVAETAEVHFGNPDNSENKLTLKTHITVSDSNAKAYMYDGVLLTSYDVSKWENLINVANGAAFIMQGGKITEGKQQPQGPIQINSGTFTMNGGEISNLSGNRGGAIFIAGSTAVANLNGGVIKNNTAVHNAMAGYGGAVFLQQGGTLNINGSVVFENNTAENLGGVIAALNSTVTIKGNPVFRNNIAKAVIDEDGNISDGIGGVIFIQDSNLTIGDCTMENNSAEQGAGAIYFTINTENSNPVFTIDGQPDISGNKAGMNGQFTESNVYLPSEINEETQQPTWTGQITLGSNISSNANIGITMDFPGVFTTNYKNTSLGDNATIFFSDDISYHVADESGERKLEPHKLEKVARKEPTCTENGNIEYWRCSICGMTFSNEEGTVETIDTVINALGHEWEADYTVDKEATCTANGSKSIHCSKCDAVKDSEVVPATGHTYGEWVVTKSATATEDGSREKVCSMCGDKVIEAIPAIGGTTPSKPEEKPTEQPEDSPQTGDNSNILLWVLLTSVSAAGLSGVLLLQKSRRRKVK